MSLSEARVLGCDQSGENVSPVVAQISRGFQDGLSEQAHSEVVFVNTSM